MDKLKEKSFIIWCVGAGLILLGCILPFASTLGISVNYISGDGKLVLIFIAVGTVLLYLKKELYGMVSSLLGALLYLFDFFKTVSSGYSTIGAYTILVGFLVLAFVAFLEKDKILSGKNGKNNMNQMNGNMMNNGMNNMNQMNGNMMNNDMNNMNQMNDNNMSNNMMN